MADPHPTPGTLKFAEIPRLPDDWWDGTPTSDPDVVWTVWDRATWYTWGANSGNYQQGPIGTVIGGGGMAGAAHGPTIGRMHPHYIGIITMNDADMPLNTPVYADLQALIAKGENVVIPIFVDHQIGPGYKLSLGTGIGSSQPNWGDIQKNVLSGIVQLGNAAGAVEIPQGTYWPDLRQSPPVIHKITCLDDISTIIDTVLS
ncbi:hypothetical protein [Hoeflea ulvae]|uniref:Uncharacterized protein n=1 Tax=Hoeflea ulvae TaxID=2983764 RepID=A0ABT3YJM8_9HYPH|nr:hypothetical protein [Hoeflea ulvae]MCY0096095.1 hypothetical protein [Hoeflea ulvae]